MKWTVEGEDIIAILPSSSQQTMRVVTLPKTSDTHVDPLIHPPSRDSGKRSVSEELVADPLFFSTTVDQPVASDSMTGTQHPITGSLATQVKDAIDSQIRETQQLIDTCQAAIRHFKRVRSECA